AGEETLKSRLEEGRLGEEDALRIFVQTVRGVQALHEHSLIHFDLKPGNIFLKGDIARVGDYGLSKLISESRLSLSFGRGTPYYMAPEMLHRRGDHRSDIYSLGVIFYECLSGRVPFTGENEWEVLKGHEEGRVDYPDSIATEYRRIIGRMLAKEPRERYQELQGILQDLKAPGRLGESIVIEYGAGTTSRGSFGRSAEEASGGPAASEQYVEYETGIGLFGGLIRALVIALLLPAKVLGLGLARGLQGLWAWPVAILAVLGKLSILLLAGVIVFLVGVILWTLLAPAHMVIGFLLG
ncbi:MAG: serine/threonine-protein kinase, partial [Planctomycetota bacterium]